MDRRLAESSRLVGLRIKPCVCNAAFMATGVPPIKHAHISEHCVKLRDPIGINLNPHSLRQPRAPNLSLSPIQTCVILMLKGGEPSHSSSVETQVLAR